VSSGSLSITAFVVIMGSSARTNDHAKAVLTHPDTPGTLTEGTRKAQVTAVEA